MAIDGRSQTSDPIEQGDLEVIPAMFEHAKRVYNKMAEQATPDPENDLMVYEGHLTNLFKELLISIPYYTTIKNQLSAMGCIEQTRRGGGNGTSKWVLWKEPELDAWKEASARKPRRGNAQVVLAQQVKDLAERTTMLEEVVQQLRDELIKLRDELVLNKVVTND